MKKSAKCFLVLLVFLLFTACSPRYSRGIWKELPPISVSRAFLAASCLEDRIYITGGTEFWVTARPVVDVFDIETESWVDSFSLPEESRAGHAQVVLMGEIWLLGGQGVSYVNDSVISYNPADDKWTEQPSMPYRLDFPAAEVVDEKIYVIGGKTPFPSEPVPYTLEFDPKIEKWIEKTPMEKPRYRHDTAVHNGKIYIFGGQSIKGGAIEMDVLEYDPENDSWKIVSHLPYAVKSHEAVAFQNRIFLIGGQSQDSAENFRTVSVFNPENGEWNEAPDMINPRMNFSCAVSENSIYVFAGNIEKDNDITTDLSELYSF